MREHEITLVTKNPIKEVHLIYTSSLVPIIGDTVPLNDGDDMFRVTERMISPTNGNIVLIGNVLID